MIGKVTRILGSLTATALAVHQGVAQTPLQTWTLSPNPTVTIGGDGSPVTEFSGIAIVARLSEGRIAVANRATSEIRVFDGQGKHAYTFGRKGSGPGEFISLGDAGRSGDTLFVYDFAQRRITAVVLGADPHLASTLRVMATGNRGGFSVSGRLSDGHWLVSLQQTPTWDGPPGIHRLPASVGVIDPNAEGVVTWFGDYKGFPVFVYNPTSDVKNGLVGLTAFPAMTYSVASGNAIWLGDSEGDSLTQIALPRQIRTIHLPMKRRAPTREMIDVARRRELEADRSGRSRAFIEAKFDADHLPRLLPFFEHLARGVAGEVWVGESRGIPMAASRYLVVDAQRIARAWVTVPAGFRVSEAGVDYVVGVHEDDDGVETVQLYRLVRK